MNISSIGFGCYRIDINVEQHREALIKAIESGINLIDTSANYGDGRSELLIGKTLDELFSSQKISREDLCIVTKAGYLQGQNLLIALKLKNEGRGFEEVVETSDRLWHSIHPGFIEDQIRRQLERMRLGYIDVYLLHNPEYYLDWAKRNRIELKDAREIYYDRIRRAFEFLEKKVAEGVIRQYGVSSNTFPAHSSEFEFTSLETLIDIANSISEKNHFKFIQLPFNLFEAGAITNRNQINNTETVLELAMKAGINVLANRPMNAITSKGLTRLADFKADELSEKDFIRQISLVKLIEEDLLNEKLAGEIQGSPDFTKIKNALTFGETIDKDWRFFGSIEHYNDIVERNFVPKLNMLIDFFEKNIDDDSTKEFFGKYLKECYKLLNQTGSYYKLRAEKRNRFIHELINSKLEPALHGLTLSQKSVLLVKSVSGINCVLAGMRKASYVDDLLKVMNLRIENADEIIKLVSHEVRMADN